MATAREEIINIYDTLPARYNIGEIEVDPEAIATGVFGSLHRGRWGDRAVAVKKFDLDNTDHNFNLAAKEMARMIRLRHQNVVNVYGFYFVPEGRVLKCSMVMELMEFDLDKYIGERPGEGSPLTDDEVVYIIAEIARGMKHVHENGYAHRDLKPQNVLMRRSAVLTGFHLDVKVADFGSSELMSAGQCDRTAGTPCYKAPEQFDRHASNLQPMKMDVYSFGCTCVKLWTGKDPPFKDHAGLMEVWEQLRLLRNMLDGVEGIITECLDIVPGARPEFSKISGALDAVLKKRQVEEVPHREEATHEEAEDLVMRRREMARELGLDGGVNGLDYADYVILPEELVVHRTYGSGVYKVNWKGAPCALKVLVSVESISRSPWFKRLPTLIHGNIVRFLGYSLSDTVMGKRHPSILMELLPQDLFVYLRDCSRTYGYGYLNERRGWKIMKGIAEGMQFLHAKDWVHGDLKPANVLVNVSDQAENPDNVVVKLIDFNLSSSAMYGTTYYSAPEVLRMRRNRELEETVDFKKADVYSFAITCSDILGRNEINWGNWIPEEFIAKVMDGWRPRLPEGTCQDLKDLITRCWSNDPLQRPSFGDICDFFSRRMPVQHRCTLM